MNAGRLVAISSATAWGPPLLGLMVKPGARPMRRHTSGVRFPL